MSNDGKVQSLRADLTARLAMALGSLSLVEKQLLYVQTVLTPVSENVTVSEQGSEEDFSDLENQPPLSDDVPWKNYGVSDDL